jgi:hypothetical protein
MRALRRRIRYIPVVHKTVCRLRTIAPCANIGLAVRRREMRLPRPQPRMQRAPIAELGPALGP